MLFGLTSDTQTPIHAPTPIVLGSLLKQTIIPQSFYNMNYVMRKPAFAADQRFCFRYMYMDSTIPLLPKSEISSL